MKKLALIVGILFSCQKEKDTRVATIETYLQGQAEHFKFNGNVLVAEHGKIIFKKSFGVSNYNSKEPLNDSSVFELASVSKQFTAAAILLLRERGQLQLTDSLRKFFPELPYSKITIRHLLTHTSGLPDYESAMEAKWDRHKIAFNDDMIKFLSKEKPAVYFLPGKKWDYSNTGYAILASIIEKVSGKTYKEFLAENIFTPLKMTHSRVYNTRRSGEVLKNYAYGFVWSDSLHKYILPDSLKALDMVFWLDGIQGDGVVNSTIDDLLKWDRAFVNHTLLSEASINEQTGQQALSDTLAKQFYGYGVAIGKNQAGNFIAHSGGWPGYTTYLARYTDHDQTIIILSNNQSPSPAISVALASILNNQPVVLPYQHTPVTLDSAKLESFVGSFASKYGKFNVERDGQDLFQVLKSGLRRKLIPESETKVFLEDGRDLQIEIEKDAAGKISYFRIMYGVKEQLEKLN